MDLNPKSSVARNDNVVSEVPLEEGVENNQSILLVSQNKGIPKSEFINMCRELKYIQPLKFQIPMLVCHSCNCKSYFNWTIHNECMILCDKVIVILNF